MKHKNSGFLLFFLIIIGLVYNIKVFSQTVAITPTVNWSCGNEHMTASTYTYVGGNQSTYRSNAPASPTAGQWVIPVVVHVLFDAAHATNDSFNISYQQIQWQISQLNKGFQNLVNPGWMPRSTNVDVQFCLAQTAIGATWTNNNEKGVMRYQVPTSTLSHTMNTVNQNLLLSTTGVPTAFPFQNYLNIFLVNEIVDTTGGVPTTGTIGYSSFPNNLLVNPIDGIVIRHDVFGSNVIPNHQNILMPQLNQGNILTHEVGHYLSMFHTFEPGLCLGTDSVTCLTQGDRICDTPPSQLANTPCTNTSTCTDALAAYGFFDQPDMTANFMCYADDNCMFGFTLDQATVMQGVLSTAWPTGRMDMTSATNLAATGLTNAGVNCCPTGVTTAHFQSNPSATCNTINFSTYVPACSMNQTYVWQFGDGNTLSTSTNTVAHAYSIGGVYNVTLTVTGTNGSTDVCTQQIQVGTYGKSSARRVCNNSVQGVNFHVATRITGVYTLDLNFNGVHTTHSYSINPAIQSAYHHPRMEDIEFNIPINLPQASLPATHIYTITLTGDSICPITFIDTFRVINCCNNIITNGDFSASWTGWTHLNGGYVGAGPGVVWTYTPSAHFDSPMCGTPSTCTALEMINTTINTPIQPSINYHLNFQIFGGNPSTMSYNGNYFLMDTLFLNARLLDSIGSVVSDFGVFPVMDLLDSTWHHYDFMFTSPNTLTHPHLSISQVKNFYSIQKVAFDGSWGGAGWGYDYSIDEISIRPEGLSPVVAVSPSSTSVCPNVSTTLTASGANTYSWSTGVTSNTTTVSPPATTVYTVTGTSVLGCTATAQSTININPAFIVVTPSAPTICAGQTTTLTASGAYTHSWSPMGILNTTVAVSPTATTVYTVTGTNTVTGCNNIKTVTVTVNPLPSITISPISASVCPGQPASLTASGANTFTWNTGQTSNSITVTPTVNTNYTVTGTNTITGCSNTKSVSVTLYSLPTLTVTPSSTTICGGQPANLTVNGAVTYTWNPSGITGSSVSVYPTSSTIYTVTGTTSVGCVVTKTTNVNVNSVPSIIATANPTNICNSQSSTLTASGGNTYTWSPIGTTSSVTAVSPTVTSIYTVTGTNTITGCSNTQTVTVNVVPFNPVLTANSTSVAVCTSGSATLSVLGANNYTWQPMGTTGASISVTPTTATIYTVSGNYSIAGCGTGSTTVLVNPIISTLCCTAPNSSISTSTITSGTYTNSGTVIDVQGVITFTGNTTFNGYTFRMKPNTLLRVVGNCTLTLNNCKLFSCSELWNGIELVTESSDDHGHLALNNTTIEDMYNGIFMDGLNLRMDYPFTNAIVTSTASVLNKNYTSIQFKNIDGMFYTPTMTYTNAPYPFSMITTTVSSYSSTTSPGSTLKPSSTYTYAYNNITNGTMGGSAPYLNFPRAYIGISLNNLRNPSSFIVGNKANAAHTNVFDNLDFGINAANAKIEAYNNYFKNITGSTKQGDITTVPTQYYAAGPDEIGIAIAAVHTTLNTFDVNVGYNFVIPTGGNPFPRGNKFENCNRGIKAINCNNVYVMANTFTASTTSLPVVTTVGSPPYQFMQPNPNTYYYYNAQSAIFVSGLSYAMETSYNDIKNYGNGIYCNYTSNSTGSGVKCFTNNIASPSATGYCMQAIQVDQSGGYTTGAAYIMGNTISDVYKGIAANSVKNYLKINLNDVSIESTLKTLNYSATSQRTGINISSCNYGHITGNNVTSNASAIPTTSTTANSQTGIYVKATPNARVECNSTYHLGRDFVFEGACGVSSWKANTMQDSYRGLEMRLSAVIGQQGGIGSPNLSANTWTTVTEETFVLATNPNSTSVLYILNNQAGNPKTLPTANYPTASTSRYQTGFGMGLQNLASGTSYTCNGGYAQRMANTNSDENTNSGGSHQKMANTSTDSLTQYLNLATANENSYEVFANEMQYQNKQLVYQLIKQDSINPAAGSTLDDFYNNNQNTAIGKLTEAETAMGSYDVAAALQANNSAPVTNMVEQKYQRANELTLKYMADFNYAFTDTEKSDLFGMANECPAKGAYVSGSRNLVNAILRTVIMYDDNCDAEADASRKKNPDTLSGVEGQTSFNLFPNPNNGAMQLDYNLGKYTNAKFNLFDITGKLIQTKNITSNEGSLFINEQNLDNGIYFYSILVGEKTIKTDKIVIIK